MRAFLLAQAHCEQLASLRSGLVVCLAVLGFLFAVSVFWPPLLAHGRAAIGAGIGGGLAIGTAGTLVQERIWRTRRERIARELGV